jgi:hypothetical protein
MHHKATKMAESGLKMTQIIAGINTFVLPMAEFLLRHPYISKSSLTKDTFYIQAKDGGF